MLCSSNKGCTSTNAHFCVSLLNVVPLSVSQAVHIAFHYGIKLSFLTNCHRSSNSCIFQSSTLTALFYSVSSMYVNVFRLV